LDYQYRNLFLGVQKERTEGSKYLSGRQRQGSFPPGKGHWWQTAKTQNITTKEIEEGSSSLVFTGDTAGHWWACSVVSSVLSETAMKSLFRPTQDTLTDFIHQPSSGRCLVFLAFLGSLCESLATEYETILAELTNAIKLGVCSFQIHSKMLY
jgi:meiotically up-regulated gene 157 (Mug157) protein